MYGNIRINMLTIKKSPTADSRTTTHKPTRNELWDSSLQHIKDVRLAIDWFIERLEEVGRNHDWTKLEQIDDFYADFCTSLEDKSFDFKKAKWFQSHLQERHHLNDRCPEDVNLFDVLERVADITMAGMARSGYIYEENIDPDMLVRAYNNTIKLLQAQIVVEE